MKQLAKTLVFTPLLVLLFIIIDTREAKTNHSAPPSGGLSGDPSRTTCAIIGCHFDLGGPFTFSPGQLVLNMGDTTTSLSPMAGQTYTPGQTYYIELKANGANGSTPRYGFQMTSLDASGNMVGAFIIDNANRNSAETLLGRNYIGHTNANSNSDWTFQWTAPASDSGAVTFYYAVNYANGDGSSSGDSIFSGTLVLNPAGTSGVSALDNSFEYVNVYPDPARDFVMLSFKNIAADKAKISLFTLDGKSVQSVVYAVQNSAMNNVRYPLPASVSAGIYLLELEAGSNKSVKRIVVM
jgi:hypothetical protein